MPIDTINEILEIARGECELFIVFPDYSMNSNSILVKELNDNMMKNLNK